MCRESACTCLVNDELVVPFWTYLEQNYKDFRAGSVLKDICYESVKRTIKGATYWLYFSQEVAMEQVL